MDKKDAKWLAGLKFFEILNGQVPYLKLFAVPQIASGKLDIASMAWVRRAKATDLWKGFSSLDITRALGGKSSLMKCLLVATAIFPVLISACKPQLFPQEVQKGVDPQFDFSHWRTFPNQSEHHKIQLGGLIVQSGTKGDTVTIVVNQLPIVEHPAYGPKDTKKRGGEFAIR